MNRPEIDPEAKLGLLLSVAERKLLDNMAVLSDGAIDTAPLTSKRTVRLSVVQLDDLADTLSAKANRTEGRMLQRRLDTLVRKIDRLTGNHLLTLLKAETPGVHAAGHLRSNKVASAENRRRNRKKPR